MIYWTAKNNNNYLAGFRSAKTMRAAVRNARAYLAELGGEGVILYFDQPDGLYGGAPVRIEVKGGHHGNKFVILDSWMY